MVGDKLAVFVTRLGSGACDDDKVQDVRSAPRYNSRAVAMTTSIAVTSLELGKHAMKPVILLTDALQ